MRYDINLFPEKEKDVVDRVMYFALHYLRYILVITQFVVICVFFFRFKVDQEIVDLKDGLQQKKQIVQSTKSLLDEVAFLEERTKTVSGIAAQQEQIPVMFNYFLSTLPPDVVLTSINIEKTQLACEGYSLNPATIQQYKEQLSTEAKFETINLVSVRKTDVGFSFSLVLENYINE